MLKNITGEAASLISKYVGKMRSYNKELAKNSNCKNISNLKEIKYSTYDHKESGLMFSIEFPRPGILDMNLYSFFVKKFLLHFVDSIILQLCLLPDRISGGCMAARVVL